MTLIEKSIALFFSLVLLMAAVSDFRFHKIPNWLTYSAVIVAVVYHTSMKGFEGFLFSVEGVGVGIAVLVIPYLVGGMGAGDAKLMGAVGGLLGPKGVFMAFLFIAIIGGIYALALLTLHGYLRELAQRYVGILRTFILTQKFIYIPPSKKEKGPRLCYGVAIALGTLISFVWGINT